MICGGCTYTPGPGRTPLQRGQLDCQLLSWLDLSPEARARGVSSSILTKGIPTDHPLATPGLSKVRAALGIKCSFGVISGDPHSQLSFALTPRLSCSQTSSLEIPHDFLHVSSTLVGLVGVEGGTVVQQTEYKHQEHTTRQEPHSSSQPSTG